MEGGHPGDGRESRSSRAALLAGEMPKEIDEAFRSAKGQLVPCKGERTLSRAASCPDWGRSLPNTVAATHYNPRRRARPRPHSCLFELRGRTKAPGTRRPASPRRSGNDMARGNEAPRRNGGRRKRASAGENGRGIWPGVSGWATSPPTDYDRPRSGPTRLAFLPSTDQ